MEKHKKRELVKDIICTHIKNNIKEYFSVIITLFIGIIIGIFTLNNANENEQNAIKDYIVQFILNVQDNNEIDKIALLKNIIKDNLILIIGLVLIGSTVIGMPIIYSIIGYKGFCFGYTISAILAVLGNKNGLLFGIATMGLQNLFYIPCILALAVSGIKLYKSIVQDKKRENIKVEILRHVFFSLLVGGVFILSSLIEAYISTNLIIIFAKYL